MPRTSPFKPDVAYADLDNIVEIVIRNLDDIARIINKPINIGDIDFPPVALSGTDGSTQLPAPIQSLASLGDGSAVYKDTTTEGIAEFRGIKGDSLIDVAQSGDSILITSDKIQSAFSLNAIVTGKNTIDIATNTLGISANLVNISSNSSTIAANSSAISSNSSSIFALSQTKLNSIAAGTNVYIDYTDPLTPVISSAGTTAGVVTKVYYTADLDPVNTTWYQLKDSSALINPSASQEVTLLNGADGTYLLNYISGEYQFVGDIIGGEYTTKLIVESSKSATVKYEATYDLVEADGTTLDVNIAVATSGNVSLISGAKTSIVLSGILPASIVHSATQRVRVSVKVYKISGTPSSSTMKLWSGSDYQSYVEVPFAISTNEILDSRTGSILSTTLDDMDLATGLNATAIATNASDIITLQNSKLDSVIGGDGINATVGLDPVISVASDVARKNIDNEFSANQTINGSVLAEGIAFFNTLNRFSVGLDGNDLTISQLGYAFNHLLVPYGSQQKIGFVEALTVENIGGVADLSCPGGITISSEAIDSTLARKDSNNNFTANQNISGSLIAQYPTNGTAPTVLINNAAGTEILAMWADSGGNGYFQLNNSSATRKVRFDGDSTTGYLAEFEGDIRLSRITAEGGYNGLDSNTNSNYMTRTHSFPSLYANQNGAGACQVWTTNNANDTQATMFSDGSLELANDLEVGGDIMPAGTSSQLGDLVNPFQNLVVSNSMVSLGHLQTVTYATVGTKLDVAEEITGEALIVDQGYQQRMLAYPKGGFWTAPPGSAGLVSGAIGIELPGLHTSTMITMEIAVMDYRTQESFKVFVAGYTNTNWNYPTAAWIAKGSSAHPTTIRFGDNGTNKVVWIGELTSAWHHISVWVSNVTLSYVGENHATWDNDFNIALYTGSFGTVKKTETIA